MKEKVILLLSNADSCNDRSGFDLWKISVSSVRGERRLLVELVKYKDKILRYSQKLSSRMNR